MSLLWSSVWLVILLLASPTWAATRFVSPGGLGSLPCPAGAPCNLPTGLNATTCGDTLILQNGTYTNGQYDFDNKQCSAGNPMLVRAENARAAIWKCAGCSLMLNIRNTGYLTIQGVVFDGTNGSNNLTGGDVKTTQPVPYAETLISVSYSDGSNDTTKANTSGHHITFDNCEFTRSSYIAGQICSWCTNFTLRNSFVHHQGNVQVAAGFYQGGPNGLYENNIFQDMICCPANFWNQSGSFVNNGIFRNNRLERTANWWDLTSNNGTRHQEVSARYQQGTSNTRYGGGAITTRGTGGQIYNNVIIDTVAPLTAAYSAVNCLIANNTVYGNPVPSGLDGTGNVVAALALDATTSGCTVRNNILYQPGVTSVPPTVNAGSNNTLDHNLCSSASAGCTIVQNPQFVGAPSNLQLASGSPAIDAGLALSQFNVDILGVSRPQGASWDLGAYEFGAPLNTYAVTRNLSTVTGGSNITASWVVSPGPGQALDWIGLVLAGGAPTSFVSTDGGGSQAWAYTNGTTTGNFTIAAPLLAGSYEFFYGINNTYAPPAARSAPFTVTTPVPDPISGFIARTMRWHKADVDEATSPADPDWLEGENTTISIKPGGKVRGRWSIDYLGSTLPADHYALYCTFDGTSWTRLITSCALFPLCIGTDTAKNSGDVTANRLTLPAGNTFCPGYFEVDSINTALTVQPTDLQTFEVEYSIQSSATLALVGDVAQCQPRHNNGVTLDHVFANASLRFGEGTHRVIGGRYIGLRVQ